MSTINDTVAKVMRVYKSLKDYGVAFIQPKLKMDLELAQRMVRDYVNIMRSIYIASDQIAVVCFQTTDTLKQQTLKERFRVGLKSLLYDPVYPDIQLEVGYNTAVSQVQDEVLQDMAYATITENSLEKHIHPDYLYINPEWKPDVQSKLDQLPSTKELDELANML